MHPIGAMTVRPAGSLAARKARVMGRVEASGTAISSAKGTALPRLRWRAAIGEAPFLPAALATRGKAAHAGQAAGA
jgi:hypothetical protein